MVITSSYWKATSPMSYFSLTPVGESRAGMFGGDGGGSMTSDLFIVELGRQCVVCE